MCSGDIQSRIREYRWHGESCFTQGGGEDLSGKDVEGLEGGQFELLQGSAELNGDKCLDDECDQDAWVSSDDWGKQDVTCARRCSPGLLQGGGQ